MISKVLSLGKFQKGELGKFTNNFPQMQVITSSKYFNFQAALKNLLLHTL